MSNTTIENVYTRQAAKELTHRHFWKLLGMILTVFVITYAAAFGCILLAGGISTSVGSEALLFVLSLVAVLAIYLVASGLGLGMTAEMLYISRNGDHVKISGVFSRMGQCLKAFGLTLWVGLKTLLWILPAYVVMFIAFGSLMMSTSTTTDLYTGTQSIPLDPEVASTALMLLPLLILVVFFALVIPAVLRYMLSTHVLADKPDTGVFECVRQSKALMKGHKWQAFKLAVPPVLLRILVGLFLTLAYTVLVALLGDTVLTSILAIVLLISSIGMSLYFSMRMTLGYCIFYTKRIAEQQNAEAE